MTPCQDAEQQVAHMTPNRLASGGGKPTYMSQLQPLYISHASPATVNFIKPYMLHRVAKNFHDMGYANI
jgi:hypothetical protein